jgi:GNAT superfamily N-acetyltransferase
VEWHRADGYVVSDQPDRLDREFVWRWLSEQSYWAQGRPRDVMERAIDGSLCFGLYAPSGEQVGFCRQVTDFATFAFLSDVFVEETHRGTGAGTFLVQIAVHHPRIDGIRQQALRTADAHGLYAKFGYRPYTDEERDTWLVRFAHEQPPSGNSVAPPA